MSVVTTRPDATVAGGGSTPTGAATAHAALADNSDASYVTFSNTALMRIGFAEPVIPAGAVVKETRARLRTSTDATTLLALAGADGAVTGDLYITWTTPTTTESGSHVGPGSVNPEFSVGYAAGSLNGKLYELFADTIVVAKPVTDPTAPTGTVTNTNRPQVAWTNTLDADGGAQTRYEVRIFSAAQYGAAGFNPASSTATAESGQQSSGDTAWTPAAILPDGTYRAYVRVGQTVNDTTHWSDWAFEGFVLDVAEPNPPTMTLTPQSSKGRIKIDLDDAATGPTTDLFEIERSDDGGATWSDLRTVVGDGRVTPSGGVATAYDFEAPNGLPTQYRVRALHSYSGIYAASTWVSGSATWSSKDWWLKHPTDPTLNLAVTPYSLPVLERAVRQGSFPVLGASRPVIIDDRRAAPAGTITLMVDTEAEQEVLADLLDDGVSVLLQGRAADHWADRWVRFASQSSARMVDKSYVEEAFETLPWAEVARPTEKLEQFPLAAGLWLPLGADEGLVDRSGNGRIATAQGGLVVGTGARLGEAKSSTDLDGVDDYVDTGWVTRTNDSPNPVHGVDLFEWGSYNYTNGVPYTRVGSPDPSAIPGVPNCVQVDCPGLAGYEGIEHRFTLTSGVTYTLSFYLRQQGVNLQTAVAQLAAPFAEYVAATRTNLNSGWQRYSMTFTATATGVHALIVRHLNIVAVDQFHVGGVLIEAGSAAGPHFPTVAQLASGEAGFTGTAHASSSQLGPFANGTVRTFFGVHSRDTSDTADTLLGGSATANATRIVLAAGSQNVLLIVGGTTYTFTNAWPGNGLTVAWALEFNETADSASLWINGVLFEAKTAVSAQHTTSPQTLLIGAHGAGSDPADGKMAHVGVLYRALSAAEHLLLSRVFDRAL